MAKKGERVLGPYAWRGYSRVIIVDAEGGRRPRVFTSSQDADKYKERVARGIAERHGKTIDEAIDLYRDYLRDVKGNKPNSYRDTVRRLRRFFPECDRQLREMTPERCAGYYELLARSGLSVDTHRNMLLEARSFLKWCMKIQKWIPANPLADVEGHGKRKRGKPQLRIDELRKFWGQAMYRAARGDQGAVAAILTVATALRCSEIVRLRVRDVDADCTILWIGEEGAKTAASRRRVDIPDQLRPILNALIDGRPGAEYLFRARYHTTGRYHAKHPWRDWPRACVQRLCREAGVPEVCAHSMRGLHATVSIDAGHTSRVVADTLGHEHESTTEESYARHEEQERAKQKAMMRVLEGGKK